MNQLLGRNCRFLQGPDTDPEAIDEIRKALREQKCCQVRLKNYRKDGSSFWNEFSVAPIRDNNGQVSHFIGIQMDVSYLQWSIEQMETMAQSITRAVQDDQPIIGALSDSLSTQAEQLSLVSKTSHTLSSRIQEMAEAIQSSLLHMQKTHETIEISQTTLSPIKVDILGFQLLMQEFIEKINHLRAVSGKIYAAINPLQEFATQTSMLVVNLAVRAEGTEDNNSQPFIEIAEAVRALAAQAETATTEVTQATSAIEADLFETLAVINRNDVLNATLQRVEEIQQQLAELVSLNSQNSLLIESISNEMPVCSEDSFHINQVAKEMMEVKEQTAHHATAITGKHQQLLEEIQAFQVEAKVL